MEGMDLNQLMVALSAIGDVLESKPGEDPDTPKSLCDAKNSIDWPTRRALYQDEIDSLNRLSE